MTTLREAFPVLVDWVGDRGLEVSAYADVDIAHLRQGSAWSSIVQELAVAAADDALDHNEVSEMAPGISNWEDARIHDPVVLTLTSPLSVRASNCLSRAGIVTWGDLARRRGRDLDQVRNFGSLSKLEVLRTCIQLASVRPHVEFAPAVAPPGSAMVAASGTSLLHEFLAQRVRRSAMAEAEHSRDTSEFETSGALALSDSPSALVTSLMVWAQTHDPEMVVGDLLEIRLARQTLPPDVWSEWESLTTTPVSALAGPIDAQPNVDGLFDELLGAFGAAQRTILDKRVLSPTPPTLEQLGETLGVTRERVRQIQVRVEKRLADLLSLPRFRVLRWRASDVRLALGVIAPIGHPTTVAALERAQRDIRDEHAAVALALVLHIAGYGVRDEWLTSADASKMSPAELAARCDGNGLLSLADAQSWLREKGVCEDFDIEWLTRIGRFRRFGDMVALWTGSVVDKCVALLAIRGEPADAEYLVASIGEGHNARGVRARFSEDERLVRVNRTEWGLIDWGMEEYSGIAEEIAQRVAQHGGRAFLQDIVVELAATFGVREASVRVYANAPMFLIKNGSISLRRDDEAFVPPGALSDCSGVYRSTPSQLSLLLYLDKETFRGSGRALLPAIGAALGVLPGNSRAFETVVGPLKVTWPISSAFGATLGSLRELATQLRCAEGDRLRIDFDLDRSEATATPISAAPQETRNRRALLQLLTGMDLSGNDPVHAVAEAIGVPPDRVLSTLRARSDSEVADLLRSDEVMDSALKDALDDLAASIGDALK